MTDPAVPKKILLVEDDRDFAESLADILKLHEYSVEIVPDLDLARSRLRDGYFPVILCDMRIGSERGLDLLEHVKQHQIDSKFLIITAFADTQTVIEALKLGANDFLRKPLEIPHLMASLKRNFEILELEKAKRKAEEAQRRHEQELEQSEERFRTLFNTSPDGILLSDPETGKIIDVNEIVVRSTGIPKQALIGQNSIELGLWQHDERDTLYRELKEKGRVVNQQIHYRTPKNDHVITGLLSAEVITVGSEKLMMTVVRDVTDFKKAEEALRKSEEQYRKLYSEFQTLLDGIPDALVLLDPELKIVWANKGAEAHFSALAGELPGKHCRDIWGLDSGLCEECLLKTFKTSEPQEKVHSSEDGRVWGMKAFPIFNSEGQVVNVIQISSDLTEKITLREQADRASRLAALGEMAAGVAHEINNPNGMVLINLGMVAQAFEEGQPIMDDYFREHGDFRWGGINYSRMREEMPLLIEEMRDAAQRIKSTVEELKGFSRRDVVSEYRDVDVNECVEAALRLSRPELEVVDAKLVLSLAEGLPRAQCVQQRIEQILVNLITNSCNALEGAERIIEIETRYSSAASMLQVLVKDSGIGIPAEHLGRLTDPFFTTRRAVGGTGLGLSLSARMAKEYGGSLDFRSSPGEGTTAILNLPAKEGVAG